MRLGKVPKPGDVVLAKIQFTDTLEVKTRPAVVLFEELNNIMVAGITSNTNMQGLPLTIKEGAIKDSIIKLNYIFTVSEKMISKTLFQLNQKKKRLIYEELTKKLSRLNS
jgi:mRNA interferase MazF